MEGIPFPCQNKHVTNERLVSKETVVSSSLGNETREVRKARISAVKKSQSFDYSSFITAHRRIVLCCVCVYIDGGGAMPLMEKR